MTSRIKALTQDQKDAICYIVGEWYANWRDRLVQWEDKTHRLGYAKEILKDMLCATRIYCRKCGFEYLDTHYSDYFLCNHEWGEPIMNIDRFRKNYNPCPERKTLSDEIKNAAEALERSMDSIDDCREKAIALTKLEEAVMWAVKGVYR